MRTSTKLNGAKKGPIISGLALVQGWFGVFVLLLLVSIVFTLISQIADWQLQSGLLMAITHLCVFGGGLWAGHKCTQRAWLNGLLVGVGAFILITWFGTDEGVIWSGIWFKRLFTMGLVSMIGGMFGGFKE